MLKFQIKKNGNTATLQIVTFGDQKIYNFIYSDLNSICS